VPKPSKTERQLPEAERDPAVQNPPSEKDVRDISEQQKLITDEWTGEGPEQR
jgi:hypothetical protein